MWFVVLSLPIKNSGYAYKLEIVWKTFFKTFFFGETLAAVSLVLGLEPSCPWPRECLSSERLSLALASDFFVSLALASSLVSSIPPLIFSIIIFIYLLLKQTLNQFWILLCKQNKIKLFVSDYKSQQQGSVKIFFKVYFFVFVVLFWFSTKIYLVYFFWSSTKIDGKKLSHFDEDLFWSSPKINEKKVTAFCWFQTAPPKKNFFVHPPHKTHYSGAGPAYNCLKRPKPGKSLFWCLTVSLQFFSSLFTYLIHLLLVYNN